MPQVLDEKSVHPTVKPTRHSDYDDRSEFNYRPVPLLVVSGIVLALLSSMAIVVWIALPIALIACLLSLVGLITIARSEGAYSGIWVAAAGVALPIIFAGTGIAYQTHLYANEVPEGYQRISFYKDISEKGFVVDRGAKMPHPDVMALDGQQIFLKGYIYPTNKMTGLTRFLLLKDNQQCCFGGKPALEDRIEVQLKGFTFDHTYDKVSISGTFHLKPQFGGGELEGLYVLEADSCTLSASDF